MRREVIKTFLLWFGFCVLGPILLFRFYFGVPLDDEFLQVAILSTMIVANLFYLCYRLYKIKVAAAVIFIIVGGIALALARLMYNRFFPGTDTRHQALQILAVLMVTTAVVHLVGRKSTS